MSQTLGSGTQLYVTGTNGDIVYIHGGLTTDRVDRNIKGIQIPVSFNNWASQNPVNRIVDLKRDINYYTFEGYLTSDSVSVDATAKKNALKAIFQYGGTITINFRNYSPIVANVTTFQFEDDANRSDLNVAGTGYNLPEKIKVSFTVMSGVNI